MIEIHEDNYSFDVCKRNYRRVILNILIQLHPRMCLEIGTHLYQTSRVFSYYFEKYKEEKYDSHYQLITADISECDRGEAPPRVWPVMVYPHVKNTGDLGRCSKLYHPQEQIDYVIKNDCSEQENIDCILFELDNMKEKVWCGCGCHTNLGMLHIVACCNFCTKEKDRPFDFVFVDAGHDQISVMRDLRIAKKLTRPEGYILIDDIEDRGHEQYNFYQNYLKPKNSSFYEIAGMGLIKNSELTL